ncbi:MAG: FkbM family methyltransferase [Pseudonocardiaceae bacterium]
MTLVRTDTPVLADTPALTSATSSRSPTDPHPVRRAGAVRWGLRVLAQVTPWVESEVLGLRSLVRPGDLCLDIGAGVGLYTGELARLVGPGGMVHSVEPLRFAHPVPAALLALRRGPNVRRHALAFGSTEGTCTMSVPLRHGRFVTGRSFLTAGARGLGSNTEFADHMQVCVPTEQLDGFAERLGLGRVAFIKVDVEGAEPDVLRGGAGLIGRDHPRLLLEIENRHLARFGHCSAHLVDWLSGFGYEMYVWRCGHWVPTDTITADHRNYLFSTNRSVPPV